MSSKYRVVILIETDKCWLFHNRYLVTLAVNGTSLLYSCIKSPAVASHESMHVGGGGGIGVVPYFQFIWVDISERTTVLQSVATAL